MEKLNKYILEKLHINKNMNDDYFYHNAARLLRGYIFYRIDVKVTDFKGYTFNTNTNKLLIQFKCWPEVFDNEKKLEDFYNYITSDIISDITEKPLILNPKEDIKFDKTKKTIIFSLNK